MVYVGKTKKFRDPIHGYIEIPDIIVSKIIDTELFQRLRYIEQTSMRPLYPAARHDRFIHSLGVYWLGRQAFSDFRKNAYIELGKQEGAPTEEWWNKQEILFSLACLLHDCAHAPFSHTLENFYTLRKVELSEADCQKLHLNINNKTILELDYQLLSVCSKLDKNFPTDFLKTKGIEIKGCGAPHEKMSAYCVVNEYKGSIPEVVNALLGNKECENQKFQDEDFSFIVRMITGCTYQKTDLCTSLKNCIIAMLNSSAIDVDGLDYIVRDSYMSGIDNFSIDYKRLLSSFTIIPIEVFENKVVKQSNIDGVWLQGSKFIIKNFKIKELKGKIDASDVPQEYKKKIHFIDKDNVSSSAIVCTESEDKIYFEGLRKGSIQCGESCQMKGSVFSGTITGKRVLSHFENKEITNNRREYILGYEKNCLSVIQSVIEARNLEYRWVYTHPKVLYNCNFLQNELLRASGRYLCCLENNKTFETDKLNFNCENCQYFQETSNEKAEEDYILYILGYKTYFQNEYEKDIQFEKIIGKGYIFYRSCDDDLNALFKRVYIENNMRGQLKSDWIEVEFKEYFSRHHRKALWKSFVEYEDFKATYLKNEDLRSALYEILKSAVLEYDMYEYGRFSTKRQMILDQYGIKNALVIKSNIKIKELDQQETYIKFKNRVRRLTDIPSFAKSKKQNDSEEFYYIYADIQQELSKENFNTLVSELDKSLEL